MQILIRAILFRKPADTNKGFYMRVFVFIFFFWFFFGAATANERIISIQVEVTPNLLVAITVVNDSNFAYCFRDDDFNFDKQGDFVFLESVSGKSIKYRALMFLNG